MLLMADNTKARTHQLKFIKTAVNVCRNLLAPKNSQCCISTLVQPVMIVFFHFSALTILRNYHCGNCWYPSQCGRKDHNRNVVYLC